MVGRLKKKKKYECGRKEGRFLDVKKHELCVSHLLFTRAPFRLRLQQLLQFALLEVRLELFQFIAGLQRQLNLHDMCRRYWRALVVVYNTHHNTFKPLQHARTDTRRRRTNTNIPCVSD